MWRVAKRRPLPIPKGKNVLFSEDDTAAGRAVQGPDDMEEGALPHPGRTENDVNLSRLDIEIDAPQDMEDLRRGQEVPLDPLSPYDQSLMPDCLDRVESGCPPGRQKGRQHAERQHGRLDRQDVSNLHTDRQRIDEVDVARQL